MDDLRGHLTPKVVHSSPDLPRPGQTTCATRRRGAARCGSTAALRVPAADRRSRCSWQVDFYFIFDIFINFRTTFRRCLGPACNTAPAMD